MKHPSCYFQVQSFLEGFTNKSNLIENKWNYFSPLALQLFTLHSSCLLAMSYIHTCMSQENNGF